MVTKTSFGTGVRGPLEEVEGAAAAVAEIGAGDTDAGGVRASVIARLSSLISDCTTAVATGSRSSRAISSASSALARCCGMIVHSAVTTVAIAADGSNEDAIVVPSVAAGIYAV